MGKEKGKDESERLLPPAVPLSFPISLQEEKNEKREIEKIVRAAAKETV